MRRDAVASLLAAPAAMLLWFHPLAWMAKRLLVDCREAACDDWVLTHGQAEATAYSADLLAIVREHFHRDQPITGLAMAQSSKVAGRVRRLLREETARTDLTTGRQLVLTGLGLATMAATTLLISCRAPMVLSPLSSDVPHGVEVVRYELMYITKEAGVKWPGKGIPKGPCTINEAAEFINLCKASREISTLTYPQVLSLMEREVGLRNIVYKPCDRPRNPDEPRMDKNGIPCRYIGLARIGFKMNLMGRTYGKDGLTVEIDYVLTDFAGQKLDPETGRKMKVVDSVSLRTKTTLEPYRPCIVIGGIQAPGKPKGTEILIVLTAIRSFNP